MGGSILGSAAVKCELGCSFVTCTCLLLSFRALTLNAVNTYTTGAGLLECGKQMFKNSENHFWAERTIERETEHDKRAPKARYDALRGHSHKQAATERIVRPWREHLPGRLVRSDTSTSPLLVRKITSGEKNQARRTKAARGLRPCFPAKWWRREMEKRVKMICIIYALLLFKTQLLFKKRLQYKTAQGNWNTRIAFFNTILTISQTA